MVVVFIDVLCQFLYSCWIIGGFQLLLIFSFMTLRAYSGVSGVCAPALNFVVVGKLLKTVFYPKPNKKKSKKEEKSDKKRKKEI